MVTETGKTTNAILTKVHYAPELNGNYISIKYLTQKGIKAVFYDNKCELIMKNEIIAVGYLKNGLYILKREKV